jgi:hypothetical protein
MDNANVFWEGGTENLKHIAVQSLKSNSRCYFPMQLPQAWGSCQAWVQGVACCAQVAGIIVYRAGYFGFYDAGADHEMRAVLPFSSGRSLTSCRAPCLFCMENH